METLLVVFPICVGLAVMRSTDARHPILLGAIGGGAAGIIGLGIPTVVWASIPLDSGMVNQYKTPIAVMFATSTVFGAVAGVIMGTLCGLHKKWKRGGVTGIGRDWPVLAVLTLLATWVVLFVAISVDPWVYFNNEPEDYIAFEARIYDALFFGTILGCLIFPVVGLIASLCYKSSIPMSPSKGGSTADQHALLLTVPAHARAAAGTSKVDSESHAPPA